MKNLRRISRRFEKATFKIALGFTCTILVLYPAMGQAQDGSSVNRLPAELIASDTVAVARVDLSEIRLSAILDEVFTPEFAEARGVIEPLLKDWLEKFRASGVELVYGTIPAEAIQYGGLCLIIPCDDPETLAALVRPFAESLETPFRFTVLQQKGRVVVCPQAVAERFTQNPTVPVRDPADKRPWLVQAFAAVEPFPHRLAFGLPPDLHDPVTDVLPETLSQAELGSVSPRRLSRHVRAAALGFDLPPRLFAELRLVSTGASASAIAGEEVNQTLEAVPNRDRWITVETLEDGVSLRQNQTQARALSGLIFKQLRANIVSTKSDRTGSDQKRTE